MSRECIRERNGTAGSVQRSSLLSEVSNHTPGFMSTQRERERERGLDWFKHVYDAPEKVGWEEVREREICKERETVRIDVLWMKNWEQMKYTSK